MNVIKSQRGVNILMKILHLSDLHFGKNLHNEMLIEDQKFWVDKTVEEIKKQLPDVVVIAGDVYDRGVPSKDAVQLFSRFLSDIRNIQEKDIAILLCAGNHDGGERLEFARELLSVSNVHIAGTVTKEMVMVPLNDEFGTVNFWIMPFVYPAAARIALNVDDTVISNIEDAVKELLKNQNIDFSQRNVIIAHQMVLNGGKEPDRSLSETAIGGVGGINSSVFDGFDYVALGHIHGAQKVGRDNIRYAGAPLCYHFSEAEQEKGLLFIEMKEKNSPLEFDTKKVPVLHKVRKTIVGKLEDIIENEKISTASDEYVRIELTDDTFDPDARKKLEAVFTLKNNKILDLARAERIITHSGSIDNDTNNIEDMMLDSSFIYFCENERNISLSEEDKKFIAELSQMVIEKPDDIKKEQYLDIIADKLADKFIERSTEI